MRLHYLQLQNFRQFFGKSDPLNFLPGDNGKKNVVVVHGANGSGKTALLNAFTWVLYEEFTRGFQYPDQLVNKQALKSARSGDTIEAWVEIAFEHEGLDYRLRRTIEVKTLDETLPAGYSGRSHATLLWCGRDGKWKKQEDIKDAIERILPAGLHHYFFFDGERIERVVHADKKEQKALSQATKMLLGVEVLDRAISHFKTVTKKFEQELRQIGDPETRRLLAEKKDREDKRDSLLARISEIERNIEQAEEHQRMIDARLKELSEVRSIQERREKLQKDHESRKKQISDATTDLSALVSAKGFSIFLPPVIANFRKQIETLRDRGQLPAGIKQQFVDDLLNESRCICRRELPPGSDPRRAVEEWRARAGPGDVEERALRMLGEAVALERYKPEVIEEVTRYQKRRARWREELARIENELDKIRDQFASYPLEKVSGLEATRAKKRLEISKWSEEKGKLLSTISDLDRLIEDLEKQRKEHEAREEKQNIATSRVNATQEAQRRVEQVRGLMEKGFRGRLEKLVADTFGRMSVTPYAPKVTDDWGLKLLDSEGGRPLPVAASQGESQILSLSFISSIIELVKGWQKREHRLLAPASSVYPMVMDSPFGSLDPEHRHQVAEHVPSLCDQVVLLLTKTQWRGEVEQSVSKRVARSYVLTYNTTRDDVEPVDVIIEQRRFPLVERSPDDFEYTIIREAKND